MLALFACLLPAAAAAAQAPPVTMGPLLQCPPAGPLTDCRPVRLEALPLAGAETRLARTVTVRPDALPLSRPTMVSIIATASSEIAWNGSVIGRNGAPGADSAHERPGRFIASFVVPSGLVRPGKNVMTARLSAHHLWLPVRRPVQSFSVGPYESPELPGLRSYLPALLALGVLLAAALYFGAAALLDRRDRLARPLAAISAVALVQLLAETARTFIAYAYPWHVLRVLAIAALAGLTAILAAAYAARRFAPRRERRAVALTAAAAAAALVLIPWYDIKAIAAILAGLVAILACAAPALREGRPGAKAAIAFVLASFGLIGWQRTQYLDQAYYLALAALLVALLAEQLLVLRRARSDAASLEQRLDRATGGDVVLLKDGGRTHRVAEADILFVRAADDYCEAVLKGGRVVLATITLGRLEAALSERFARVHKSYVVNRAEVAAVARRPGGGPALTLTDGSSVPVGRRYLEAVASMQAPSPRAAPGAR